MKQQIILPGAGTNYDGADSTARTWAGRNAGCCSSPSPYATPAGMPSPLRGQLREVSDILNDVVVPMAQSSVEI